MKNVELEIFQAVVQSHIIPEDIPNTKIKAFLHPYIAGMTIKMHSFIWGEKLQTYRESYPINWIEALKDRFLPRVLRKWFPVKYRAISIDVAATYPKFVLSKEKYGPMHINIIDMSRDYTDSGPEEDDLD